MKLTDLAEDSEDSGHTPAERIAAATIIPSPDPPPAGGG